MIFRVLTAIFLVLSVQNAHALFGSDFPQDPAAVYEMGSQQLRDKKFKKAIKTFEHFLKAHSNSELLPKAKIRLADAHFGKENFHDALKLYERSHLEAPHSEEGSHTLYRMGECNMQFITNHKGQKYIPYAIAAFERFVTLYPEHTKVEEAGKNIKKAKRLQAEYQIEVGNYYYRHKDYCAAFNHFEKVLKMEDYGTYKTVDSYISKCQKKEACLDELAACEFDLTEVNARMK